MNEWFRAEGHAEQAHRHFEAGEWEKALAELKRALEVNPQQVDWHYGMGLTLEEMHRYSEAAATFRRVIDLRGEDVETMTHLASNLIRIHEYQNAVDVLERMAELDPEYEPSFCYRVLAYGELGRHDEAEQMFYMARQLVEECPHCYDHMGRSLAMRNEWDRAIWCWQQTLRLAPHHPGIHGNLARAHWRRRQYTRAQGHYLQQVREDPGDVQTLLELGQMLIEMGKYADAREKFRRVLELDPACADAHLFLGETALAAGHLDAADADLQIASRLDPAKPGIRLALAQVSLQRGLLDDARKHLAAEMELIGHDVNQKLELARMLIELRRPSPTVQMLTPLIEASRREPLEPQVLASALLYRGAALMLIGRHRDGIRDCRDALKIDPRNVLAMHNISLASLEQGRLRRARYWLHKAMAIRADDAGLRQLRGRVNWAIFIEMLRRSFRRIIAREAR